MKRLLILGNALVLGLLAVNVYADHNPRLDGPPVVVARGFQMKTLTNVMADLDEVTRLNESGGGRKWQRQEIRTRLDRMRASLEMLHEEIEQAPVARGGHNVPTPPTRGPNAMNEREFQDVLAAYRTAYYTSQKFVVLQEVAQTNFFTVDQVVRLMNETYWASDKVKAASLLYPRTVDKENWYKVYSALQWESDREELRKLTSGNNGRPVR